jgi:hypothetical protein
MKTLLVLAGLGQLGLVGASTLIPRLLHWREETAKLRPLTRQVFTIYALYIFATNLAFGLLSTLRPEWLLDGTGLARAVSGFIALYWGARLVIQFSYYDRKDAPPGLFFRIGEVALVALFFFLTCVYGLVAFGGHVR